MKIDTLRPISERINFCWKKNCCKNWLGHSLTSSSSIAMLQQKLTSGSKVMSLNRQAELWINIICDRIYDFNKFKQDDRVKMVV